ncbi:cell adhesion molecule Dscam2-like [Danaus plexippus]|uniref:cell adhesion molecule Dscam2-like n=1 Tax=Danaus plexippus TaxID=13037 RepID=UPI002AB2E4EC|nr:cell adhesion molecule Dscam2-like [Danaus plexippus]
MFRRVYGNGTLEVFPSNSYESSAMTVRCRAANPHGAIISRDVTLHPVADTKWEVLMSGGSVSAGGIAALWCRPETDHGHSLATPALFYRGDRVMHIDPPSPDARYLLAGSALLIRDASPADAGSYSCLARHALTALTKRSRPAHLNVLTGSSNSPPRLVATESDVTVPAGATFCMPCVASEYPPPQYTWYRERNGRLQPVEPNPSVWLWAGGAALCFTRVSRDANGAWLCKAYNVFGDATAQMRIEVEDTFSVSVDPSVVVAEAGSTVRLNCTATDPSATLRWAHNGAVVSTGGESLILRGLARAHAGLYQCLARRGSRTEQAAAEIRLGDSPPELQYTFIEQALRAGSSVTLRCIAAASPPPRITWLLDDHPLDHFIAHHRYSISEEASVQGEVVSVLNVTSATAADGGRYSCRASNPLGAVEHSARLNIYGPPSIRPISTIRAVAGENLTLHCPYAGYPIRSIEVHLIGSFLLQSLQCRGGVVGRRQRWAALDVLVLEMPLFD